MKFIIVFAALLAVAIAAPPQTAEVSILKSESEVGTQSFQYAYETSDGAGAEAQGHVNNIGKENEAISVKGSFKYVGNDGVTYSVNYIADENGFQPQGAHLPVAPVV